MSNFLVRSTISVLFGVLVALPFLFSIYFFNVNVANAQVAASLYAEDVQVTSGLSDAELNNTIGGLIKVALGLLGILMVVIMLMGGFQWMVASENDENKKNAMKAIVQGIIGLVIIVSAYSISNFLVENLLNATS